MSKLNNDVLTDIAIRAEKQGDSYALYPSNDILALTDEIYRLKMVVKELKSRLSKCG